MKKKTKAVSVCPPGGHTQMAYDGIRNMLFYGEIVPGQKISYRDLAERLNMSQTPVIQALKWLEFQHLVRHEPNRGYYTETIDLQEVSEIYDLRELIECALLPRTIRHLDAAGRRRLETALQAHADVSAGGDLYARLRKDIGFHLTLADLSGCRLQQKTLQNLFDLLYLKYGGNYLFSTSIASADTDHAALVAAIVAKDSAQAKRLLSRHIRRVKKHVVTGVEKTLAVRQTGRFSR